MKSKKVTEGRVIWEFPEINRKENSVKNNGLN